MLSLCKQTISFVNESWKEWKEQIKLISVLFVSTLLCFLGTVLFVNDKKIRKADRFSNEVLLLLGSWHIYTDNLKTTVMCDVASVVVPDDVGSG